MTITVKNDTNPLLELLWLREAWGLQPVGEVPPFLTRPPARIVGRQADEGWEESWTPLWKACVEHAGASTDTTVIARLQVTPPASAERANLLRGLVGPSWRDKFGDHAFDESFTAWHQEVLEDIGRANAVPLDQSPERRALEALVSAWQIGLATVVTIPCQGEFTRVISHSALLVTESTRHDERRYSAALNAFRQGEHA
jgi:hypothetical protein